MADEVGGVLGGVAKGAGNLVGSALGGIKNVAGGVADVVGSGLHALGGGVGELLHPTGQPASGMPSATQALLSQGTPALDDIASGAGKAATGLSSVASAIPEGDYSLKDIFDPNSVSKPSVLQGVLGGVKTAVPAIALGATLLNSNKDIPGAKGMEASARDAQGRSTQLANAAEAAFEGKLPGTRMQSFDNQADRAKAAIRQRYAGMGMSGSTAEAQDLAAVDQQVQQSAFQEAQTLASTGFKAAADQSGISADLYGKLWDIEHQRGSEFSTSLQNFLKAVSGLI